MSSTRRSTGGRSAASASRSARRGSRSSCCSGVNAEVVVTVAWDISWYQYRISPDSDNPVRLEGRGHDPAELEGSFTEWNAQMDDAGRIVPDIARLVIWTSGAGVRRSCSYTATVIYCVIPRELEAELFEKMVEYYKDNPNVTVIVDRREGPDRRSGQEDGSFKEQRIIRDRRRARATGTFPDTDVRTHRQVTDCTSAAMARIAAWPLRRSNR